jgi:signal transduction histidine kinase
VITPVAPTTVVRIFLLDDTRELRQRVRRALTEAADLTVVGEADDPVDGLPLIVDLQPDVVVCDLSMPRMDGLEAIPHIARSAPDAGIVVFSGFLGEALGETVLAVGADRYVEKSAPLDQLADAVREVADARRAGYRPVPTAEPGAQHVPPPPAVPAPVKREERPLDEVLVDARQVPLRVIYLLSALSALLATGLSVLTGLPPGVFAVLWIPPVLALGALAPRVVLALGGIAGVALFWLAASASDIPRPLTSAIGVAVAGLALGVSARRLYEWMQRRVDHQAALAGDLRRSNAELEHFAYVASHDLAAPLRSISSFATMLGRRYEGQLDDEADKMIGYITGGTRRMQRMIDDLLAFARAGRMETHTERFSLSAVLDEVRGALAAEISDRGAKVVAGPLPDLVGDESRILQVVQNLVANAIKFCPPERTPVITVTAARLTSGWRIDVRDNGIGVDPRYASKVFGMFQRLHSDEDFPGTGIGLAICQRVVERHGGRIWVDGYEGEGSTFSFTIPDQPSS